jgi:ABC-2 type transport system permease protein
VIRAVRAQLLVLRRPAVLGSLLGALPARAVLASSLVFAGADDAPPAPGETGPGSGVTLSSLSEAGGMTAGFSATAGLLGLMVLVLFLSLTAGEHTRGTLRVLLTREPRRLRLVGGQVVAVLLVTYAALALALLASSGTAFVAAALRDVPTDAWTSAAALREAGLDGARAAAAATGYGLLGAALGTVVRSLPVALGVGLAWFLPVEHIVQNNWAGAGRWFPGLLMEALSAGGTTQTSATPALAVGGLLIGVAVLLAAVDLRRRDVLA